MGLAQTYRAIAEGDSATFHPFGQAQLLATLPPNSPSRKGICRALCLYEAHFSKANRSEEFVKEIKTLVQKASALQEDVTTEASDMSAALAELYRAQAPKLGLDFVAVTHWLPGVENWLQGVVAHTTRRPFYVQMFLPNHVVSMRPSKKGGMCFYDRTLGRSAVQRPSFSTSSTTSSATPRYGRPTNSTTDQKFSSFTCPDQQHGA